jgi:hypothetical protein
LFAVQVLDAVTLERVSQGLQVVAEGLHGKPIVNTSGMFVWLKEDITPFRKITIDPGVLPYQRVEREAGQLQRPLATIELPPSSDYPFAAGITGLRGTLVEARVVAPQQPTAVPDAEIHLRWLDDDGVTWRDAPTVSRTDSDGDFVAVVRLARTELPQVKTGALTVRVRARRSGLNERGSSDLLLPQGRVADPSTFAQGRDALLFAWDELSP